MTNDTMIAELMWFGGLSSDDKLVELKKNLTLCYLCDLFPKDIPIEGKELCKTHLEFRML